MSGKVRYNPELSRRESQLLCKVCNTALTRLDVDREWAMKAVRYLEEYDASE